MIMSMVERNEVGNNKVKQNHFAVLSTKTAQRSLSCNVMSPKDTKQGRLAPLTGLTHL